MLYGLNNAFESEALPGALPRLQNNPQTVKYDLYAEQLSGTAFTRPRANNRSVWLYRIHPSSARGDGFVSFKPPCAKDAETLQTDPNPGRWGPVPEPPPGTDFIHGLRLFGQAGSPETCEGLSIYLYSVNKSMDSNSVSFHDGEVLIVPQRGSMLIRTELGELEVEPENVCVIPRGVKCSVVLKGETSKEAYRGYMVEVYNEGGFRLPDLGLIGANGQAHPLHFAHPVAKFEHREYKDGWSNVIKVNGEWFRQDKLQFSPYDVVAWKGNYLPYTYDLRKFVSVSSVSVDHPDPSIFTVLTVPTSVPGVAACDFVIFPPRWMVSMDTFRPPYFHRNVMTEFMGLIKGAYDGKKAGFVPGGASLHSRMVPHGPDTDTFLAASKAELKPVYYDAGLAFMFETAYFLKTTDFARNGPHREHTYASCWKGLPRAKL